MNKPFNISSRLIATNPSFIKYVHNTSLITEEEINRCMDLGYKPTLADLKNNHLLGQSTKLIETLIDEGFPNAIKYINKLDEQLIKKAMDKGYIPAIQDVLHNYYLRQSDSIFKVLLKDPNAIRLYQGSNQDLIDFALKKGFEPSISDLDNNYSLAFNDNIMKILIKIDYKAIYKYKGYNVNVLELACENGLTDEELLENIDLFKFYVFQSDSIMLRLIEIDPSIIELYALEVPLEAVKAVLERGYSLSERIFKNCLYQPEVAGFLLAKYGYEYISKMSEVRLNADVYEWAIKFGYLPSEEEVLKLYGFEFEIILPFIIDSNPSLIRFYTGSVEKLYLKAYKKGYRPSYDEIRDNYYVNSSYDTMKYLIGIDYNYISCMDNFSKNFKELFYYAVGLGYIPSKEDVIINTFINYDYDLLENLVKSDYTYAECIQDKLFGLDYDKIEYIYSVAINLGYRPSYNYIKNNQIINTNFDLMSTLLEYDVSYIKYANIKDSDKLYDLYTKVMKKGYIPNIEEVCKHDFLNVNYNLMKRFIKINPNYASAIIGTNYTENQIIDLYMQAIDLGFRPTEIDLLTSSTCDIEKVMEKLAHIDKRYILFLAFGQKPSYASWKKELFKANVNNGNIPSINEVKKSPICNDYIFMFILITKNVDYIKCIFESNLEDKQKDGLYSYAMSLGFEFTKEIINNNPCLLKSSSVVISLIKNGIDIVERYSGTDINIFKLSLEKGYRFKYYKISSKIDENLIEIQNDIIMQIIKSGSFDILNESVKLYESNIADSRFYKIIIRLGYIPNIKEITNETITFFNSDTLEKIIDKASEEECIDIIVNYNLSDINRYIIESKKIDFNIEYLTLLNSYQGDKKLLLRNYSKYVIFLKESSIDESKFIQYGFCQSYDFIKDMVKIIEKGKKEEFIKVKEFFYKEYYFKNTDFSDANNIRAYLNIIKNYSKYPELCLDAIRTKLTDEEKEKINFLFEYNGNIKIKPNNLSDLDKIFESISLDCKEKLSHSDYMSIYEVKDLICNLLFNQSLSSTEKTLSVYGNTKDLRQLLFENRDNPSIHDLIGEMMIYTSMMEAIISYTDKDYLIEMTNSILDNLDLTSQCMMLFSRYDEKMQELYSNEINSNLTVLKDTNLDGIIDRRMTLEYGIPVVDLSDKEYCLLAHVKSSRESTQQIISGFSDGNLNFISLSPISYRNQVYYKYNPNRIIFGYDYLLPSSFIQSSVSNLASRFYISNNSIDIKPNELRSQRGVLETSTAPSGHNSEILSFRQELKPKYIILPNGRKPTLEEIEIAKKYGLKFVKTQDVKKTITNPRKIDSKYLERTRKKIESKNIEKLKDLRKALIKRKDKSRKIAIFTDSHALFEPTLAILEDARKNGITEIYSLGDNIGTGPNPKEVIELLEEYGVQTLAGNHELYAALGVDEFKPHLMSSHGFEEAKRNSTWTRLQLNPKQLEIIKNTPQNKVIEIGGQKILLTHFAYDYNTGQKLQIPDNISHVFQGHKHFEKDEENITTLRGAGIGHSFKGKHQAYYIILNEKQDGGFDIERRLVQYDYDSLYYDIITSDMNEEDKSKIERWAGVSR